MPRKKDKSGKTGKSTNRKKVNNNMPISQKVGLIAGIVFILGMSVFMLQGKGLLDLQGFSDEAISAEGIGFSEVEMGVVEEKLDMLEVKAMGNDNVNELKEAPPYKIDDKPVYFVYLSISDSKTRAHVLKGEGQNLDAAWDSAREKTIDFIRDTGYNPVWIKADVVDNVTQIQTTDLKGILEPYYEHFYKNGLAFDQDFQVSLIESEINGNKVISSSHKTPKPLSLSFTFKVSKTSS